MLLLTGAMLAWAVHFGSGFPTSQKPVVLPGHRGEETATPEVASGVRSLQGRFLQISGISHITPQQNSLTLSRPSC
jgi:hypothetical protein